MADDQKQVGRCHPILADQRRHIECSCLFKGPCLQFRTKPSIVVLPVSSIIRLAAKDCMHGRVVEWLTKLGVEHCVEISFYPSRDVDMSDSPDGERLIVR